MVFYVCYMFFCMYEIISNDAFQILHLLWPQLNFLRLYLLYGGYCVFARVCSSRWSIFFNKMNDSYTLLHEYRNKLSRRPYYRCYLNFKVIWYLFGSVWFHELLYWWTNDYNYKTWLVVVCMLPCIMAIQAELHIYEPQHEGRTDDLATLLDEQQEQAGSQLGFVRYFILFSIHCWGYTYQRRHRRLYHANFSFQTWYIFSKLTPFDFHCRIHSRQQKNFVLFESCTISRHKSRPYFQGRSWDVVWEIGV